MVSLKKGILLIAAIAIVTCVASPIKTTAHECVEPGPLRFIDVYETGSLWWKHKYVKFKIYGDLLSTDFSSAFTNSLGNWNNNSDGYVVVKKGTNSYGEYPKTRACIWDHTWQWGSQYAATALDYNSGIIKGAHIYINKELVKDWSLDDKEHTIGHEIGHIFGFDDTNVKDLKTIMKQGRGSTFGWSNYDKPQSHDRSDLKSFYP